MSASTLRLVLLVSCAHALVHVFELSLPSVEQSIAAAYVPGDEAAGKQMTGLLQTCWRLPWGLGAVLAGWLVDRWGSKGMLAVYLLGAAATCILVGLAPPLPLFFLTMFAMGSLACIYHPAGLALISHEVAPRQLPLSLGIHGVFGSLGIGATPLVAGLLLARGASWETYFWLLAVPGLLLGSVFVWQAWRHGDTHAARSRKDETLAADDPADWPAFFTLTVLALLQGFVYSAVLSFLPRYLGHSAVTAGGEGGEWSGASFGALVSGGVLLVGCVGQFVAGMWARSERLEQQLTWITLGNAPFLFWMSLATGWQTIVAASLFALIHFMHQPIYNSLIARYSPRRHRSRCYGFSFAMGLGVGSLGATFAGFSTSNLVTYGTLGAVALAAAMLGAVLWRRAARHGTDAETGL
ncbi:MAG: MFS transporter [Pirellulaceae bacterium]|nr:MFS transporter [Pirellulaceae bacterium]